MSTRKDRPKQLTAVELERLASMRRRLRQKKIQETLRRGRQPPPHLVEEEEQVLTVEATPTSSEGAAASLLQAPTYQQPPPRPARTNTADRSINDQAAQHKSTAEKRSISQSALATPKARVTRGGVELDRVTQKAAQDFLLREYAVQKWIASVLGEPQLHPKNTPDKSLQELLADGVKLCRLMLQLRPRSVPTIYDSEKDLQLGYKVNANIEFFLAACEECGIASFLRFSVEELREGSNMLIVLDCLETLAEIAESEWSCFFRLKTKQEIIRKGVAFSATQKERATFSIQQCLSFSANRRSFALKPVDSNKHAAASPSSFATLRTVPSSSPSLKGQQQIASLAIPPLRQAAGSPPVPAEDSSAKLSQPDPQQILLTGMIRLQAVFRGRRARKYYKRLVINAAYRENVAKEIYVTEVSYVGNLTVLSELFLAALECWKGDPTINLVETKTLAKDVAVITAFNKSLLKDMEPRIKNWNPRQTLGDIFVMVSNFLKVYTQYVQQYSRASFELQEAKRSSAKLTEFLEKISAMKEVKGMAISGFLIQPIQRIPRYLLLLKELAKHTEPDHADYQPLQEALAKIQDVAEYIEQRAKEAENSNRMLSIQNRLIGKQYLLEPTRQFLREGRLKASNKHHKKPKERMIFLFSDILLEARILGNRKKSQAAPPSKASQSAAATLEVENSGQLDWVESYDLHKVIVTSEPDFGGRESKKHCFVLQEGEAVLVRLFAPSKVEKHQWIRDIVKAQTTLQNRLKGRQAAMTKLHSKLSSEGQQQQQQQLTKEKDPKAKLNRPRKATYTIDSSRENKFAPLKMGESASNTPPLKRRASPRGLPKSQTVEDLSGNSLKQLQQNTTASGWVAGAPSAKVSFNNDSTNINRTVSDRHTRKNSAKVSGSADDRLKKLHEKHPASLPDVLQNLSHAAAYFRQDLKANTNNNNTNQLSPQTATHGQ
ncbi:Calponin domain containing protein [Balamuthia mandrillaris]